MFSVKHNCAIKIARLEKIKILGELRTAVPMDEAILRSERSSTVLAGPGGLVVYYLQKIFATVPALQLVDDYTSHIVILAKLK